MHMMWRIGLRSFDGKIYTLGGCRMHLGLYWLRRDKKSVQDFISPAQWVLGSCGGRGLWYGVWSWIGSGGIVVGKRCEVLALTCSS
jgi:hypothetical protein